jgi:hypothetical protein
MNSVLEAGAELLIRAITNGPESLLGEWAKKKVDVF